MAKFQHVTENDWEWLGSMAASIYRERSPAFKPFEHVMLTGDQFLRMYEELRRVEVEMIDRDDVTAIEQQLQGRADVRNKKG